MSVTQDYKITISADEMRTVLCAIDARIKLTERYMGVRDADTVYWQGENEKAIEFRNKLRSLP